MKDFKTSLLFLLSLLLLIAVLLLGTVFYHFYYRKPVYTPVLELSAKNDIIIASSSRDSLYKEYTSTLQGLSNRLDTAVTKADSVNSDFDSRIDEFNRLKEEIAAILKTDGAQPDLAKAGVKIGELQQKLSTMQFVNRDIAAENKRLAQLIAQMKKQETVVLSQRASSHPASSVPLVSVIGRRKTGIGNFTVTDLSLVAVTATDVQNERETTEAKLTDKLAGSFFLYHSQPVKGSEIMLVIVQPNGKVFQGSTWDVGSFTTPQGKKIYSRKFNIDFKKGESRKLTFAIAGDEFQAGTYVMQLYQNGVLIARTKRVLL